jgi:hypothetical protein
MFRKEGARVGNSKLAVHLRWREPLWQPPIGNSRSNLLDGPSLGHDRLRSHTTMIIAEEKLAPNGSPLRTTPGPGVLVVASQQIIGAGDDHYDDRQIGSAAVEDGLRP